MKISFWHHILQMMLAAPSTSARVRNEYAQCDICYKFFTRKSYMVQHRKLHSGEKPYSCGFCAYRSSQQSNLATHILKFHSNIYLDE